MYWKIIRESFIQAVQQLVSNKMRSFLSLVGVSIGIFCIITVKSAVNSLEDDIRKSFKKLGNDVIYISKMPWNEDPDMNYWKYQRRPNPGFADYKMLSQKLKTAKSVAFSLFVGQYPIKFGSNAVEKCFAVAVTEEYASFNNLEFEQGRFFSATEYNTGANRIVIGHNVATELFGTVDAIGREVKVFGRTMIVSGVIKKAGKSIIQFYNFDNIVLVSFELARSMFNVRPNSSWAGNLQAKAADGITEEQLKDDVIVTLRNHHRLRPSEKTDFSLNSMTMFAGPMEQVFGVLNLVGYIIGGFALLVGMFSVANIMFVSVKERTNIIGIKKALGAKKWVILLEFLIESIILCVVGGIIGLLIVLGVIKLVAIATDFNMFVSINNMIVTVIISVVTGVLAGMIPAVQASKMDPVEAIRA
jgi:putative ABC transport system permease protein